MALQYTFTKEANGNVSVAILDMETNTTTYKSFLMLNVNEVVYNPNLDIVTVSSNGEAVLTLTYGEVSVPNTGDNQALWDALQTTYFFKPTVAAGSGFTLANNGVSDFGGTTVQLGGSLIQNTTIAAGANDLNLTATTGTIKNEAVSGGITSTTAQTNTAIVTTVEDATNSAEITHNKDGVTTIVSDGTSVFTSAVTNTNIQNSIVNGANSIQIEQSLTQNTTVITNGANVTEIEQLDYQITTSTSSGALSNVLVQLVTDTTSTITDGVDISLTQQNKTNITDTVTSTTNVSVSDQSASVINQSVSDSSITRQTSVSIQEQSLILTSYDNATNSTTVTQTPTTITTTITDGVDTNTTTITASVCSLNIGNVLEETGTTYKNIDINGNTVLSLNGDGTTFGFSIAMPITSPAISVNTLLTNEHFTVLVDASGGNIIITVPDASTCSGRLYNIVKIDNSINTVEIIDASGKNIKFATSQFLYNQGDVWNLQSASTQWIAYC